MEARPVNKRTTDNDTKRTAEFASKMVERWRKGRNHYGTVVKIDPLEEAMEECIDIANYAMEQYFRIKALREKLKRRR